MSRYGRYHPQPAGYQAFLPVLLNPPPEIFWDQEAVNLLFDATRDVSELDACLRFSANAQRHKSMLWRIDSIASCFLDGIDCRLIDLLRYEIDLPGKPDNVAIRAVSDYLDALRELEEYRRENPHKIDLTSLKTIHKMIMRSNRRPDYRPGEFRRAQSWVGEPGSTKKTAEFVPPPPAEMNELLKDMEIFWMTNESNVASQLAWSLAQLESIRPFYDGNGRAARAMLVLLAARKDFITQPYFPLSTYLAQNTEVYYQFLRALRNDGTIENWFKFFFVSVTISAVRASKFLAEATLLSLQDEKLLETSESNRLLNYFCQFPILTVQLAAEHLDCAFATAKKVLEDLIAKNIVHELTGQKRNRQYVYSKYIEIWERWEAEILIPSKPEEKLAFGTGQDKTPPEDDIIDQIYALRNLLIDSQIEEEDWRLEQKPVFLTALYRLGSLRLHLTLNVKSGLTIELQPKSGQTITYNGIGPHLDIELLRQDQLVVSWSFKVIEFSGRLLWQPVWEANQKLTSATLANMCVFELRRWDSLTKAKSIEVTIREREIAAKHQILEMFLAILSVLGRQVQNEIYWEDDRSGASLVYKSRNVRNMLWFSTDEILRFAVDEALKQKLRERIADAIRRIPLPPASSS